MCIRSVNYKKKKIILILIDVNKAFIKTSLKFKTSKFGCSVISDKNDYTHDRITSGKSKAHLKNRGSALTMYYF